MSYLFQAFFAELPSIQNKFIAAKASALAQGVLPEQVNSIGQRLEDIGAKAAQRRVRLKFLEHKVRSA